MKSLESEILEKLDMLIKITAVGALRGREFREQVKLLNDMGFKPKHIASILGKSPNHISVILFGLKKEVKDEKNKTV